MTQPIDTIEADIRAAIERLRGQGHVLRASTILREATVEMPLNWRLGFVSGFAGRPFGADYDPAAYALGRRLREEYIRE